MNDSILNSISKLNQTRAKHEKISTAIIHSDQWSIENDLLTPTLKVKHANVDQKFGELYLQWHEDNESIIWI